MFRAELRFRRIIKIQHSTWDKETYRCYHKINSREDQEEKGGEGFRLRRKKTSRKEVEKRLKYRKEKIRRKELSSED